MNTSVRWHAVLNPITFVKAIKEENKFNKSTTMTDWQEVTQSQGRTMESDPAKQKRSSEKI